MKEGSGDQENENENENETKQYSLWLRPKGRQKEGLASVVRELSNTFGTECFEPHVTLLSMFETRDEHLPEILSELERVAKNFKPFRIPLQQKVTAGERFFQCVYILCEKPPALLDLHEAVKSALLLVAQAKAPANVPAGLGPHQSHVQLHLANPTYMPHLSLLYGDLSAEQKKVASQDAEERMRMPKRRPMVTVTQENESGPCTCMGLWSSPQGIEIESFDVYLTPMRGDHSTKDWSHIAEMKLQPSPSPSPSP